MTVADCCAELALLAPMLEPALRRDTTSTGTWAHSGFQSALSLYNTDVLLAKIIVTHEVPAAAIRCCQLVNEPWPASGRTWGACLRGIPRWHDRLEDLQMATEARLLATAAAWWVRVTKLALGLRSHTRPLPAACPHCAAGTLHLDAGTEGFVNPQDLTAPPTWIHGAHVYCTTCGQTWPQTQWEWLLRLIEQARAEQRQVSV